MDNPLFLKFRASGSLNEADRATLDFLCRRSRQVGPRIDLVSEGERPDCVHIILEGFACRYKFVREGTRQITALLVPGDLCDLTETMLGPSDHAVGTLTKCKVVEIPHAVFGNLISRSPGISYALQWAFLVEHRVLRGWLINLGQRRAEQRMAHFFCEMLMRLQAVEMADEGSYAMPFRQPELGDILGITSVHVNRSLKELREANLVVLKKRRVTILDIGRLKSYCGFNPSYLHLLPRAKELSFRAA